MCPYDLLVKQDCFVSANCTDDSNCLSNKCFNNACIFNEENPIVYCTNEYSYNAFWNRRKSVMHCGKAPMDGCTEDKECGSNECIEGECMRGGGGPSESETAKGVIGGAIYLIIGIVVLVVLLIAICCYCFIKKHKKRNKIVKKKKKKKKKKKLNFLNYKKKKK